MKKYIVISLTVGGLGNKIFNYGDIVNESSFPKGNAERLVANGFLKPATESETAAVSDTVVAPKTDLTPAPEYSSVTKAELMEKLTADGIDFDVRANKETLYDLAYPKASDGTETTDSGAELTESNTDLTEEQIIAENKSAAEANLNASSDPVI
jgi:hypothetical protein